MTVPLWQDLSVYLDRCEDAGQDTALGRAYVLLLRAGARTLRLERASYDRGDCFGSGGSGGDGSGRGGGGFGDGDGGSSVVVGGSSGSSSGGGHGCGVGSTGL